LTFYGLGGGAKGEKHGDRVGINDVFKALSDPTRRQILRELREGDCTAGELADLFPLAKSTLSGHFNVLKHAGLIVSERQATTIVYSLNISVFEEAMGAVMDLMNTGEQAKPTGSEGSGDE
jgi:DNA-binding transcriptional ArsR family regulator